MKRWFKAAGWLVATLAALYLFCPKPSLYGGISFSTAVYDAHGKLLRLTLADDDRYRLFVPLRQIAPAAVEGTLLYEDEQFYHHPGVNPVRLLDAFWTTYIRRSRRVGGSTISMQLARIRFNIDSSTLSGKLIQILRALQIERHYSKHQILEAYLNLAPYGGNVEGIGTASRVYFGKPAADLSLSEALTLCVIPQNPTARTPSPRGGPTELGAARLRLFAQWVAAHPADAGKTPLIKLPLIARTPADLPFRAPHFTRAVLEAQAPDFHGDLTTSLDLKLQTMVEQQAKDYVARHRAIGINNVSVLLVDYRNMEIKAMLGSVDFFNNAIDGQVNGTEAKRSPGSALKPFIYALALQQGLIQPMTLLRDAPTHFGVYTPENFDRGFMGPVFATQALVQSRNIPAVDLMSRLHDPGYYQFLQQAGITNLRDEKYYGLALALGGAEVTMEEMARLYAILPNHGLMRALRMVPSEDKPAAGKPMLSPEASFLTLEMLAQNPRPRATDISGANENAFPVYWKTGTSFAFRDAWSAGIFGPYVMIVWVGNFDGAGNPAFVGREAAGPLFFDIVDALHAKLGHFSQYRATPQGLNVKQVRVCATTGDLPSRYCPGTTRTWFIPGVSPIRTSDIYRRIAIDTRTGRRACRIDSRHVRYGVYEFWPSDLLRLFREAGIQRRTPPPYDTGCSMDVTAANGLPPRISSPQSSVTYSLPADQVHHAQLPLSAITDADTRKLFWFVDARFVGASTPDKPLFWTLKPGDFTVRVVDDEGRAALTQMHVQLVPVTQ